jgi:hypothetical protein
MKIRKLLIVVAIAMLVNAQPSEATSWKRIQKPLAISVDKTFSTELPVGWVRAFDDDNVIVATQDGAGIQLISAVRTRYKDAFKKLETKKQKKANQRKLPKDRKFVLQAGMLPTEVAELVIADIQSGNEFSHVRVISNEAAVIDGNPGFRIHFKYKNAKGLQFDHIIGGFIDDKNLYRLVYRAPSKIYFDRDLDEFEKALSSFKVLSGKKK